MYKISEDLALIQTVDFFTPIVDDPFTFGQIAAANALSDIYAMGGVPKTAMNLVGFPSKEMDLSVLRSIILGGIDKMKEAGVVLVGGHSVEDSELKYGLSVTGFIHPSKVLVKRNIRPGDRLVLTKALGTGIINTAIKGGLASPQAVDRAVRTMSSLNKKPAEILSRFPANACTDITGFGFLGHLAEMVEGSTCGARIFSGRVPVLPETLSLALMGLIPAGAYNNRKFRIHMVEAGPKVEQVILDILFDPQTSGGLLVSIPEPYSEPLAEALKEAGIEDASIVGEVIEGPERIIIE